jgi:hypothetical protein
MNSESIQLDHFWYIFLRLSRFRVCPNKALRVTETWIEPANKIFTTQITKIESSCTSERKDLDCHLFWRPMSSLALYSQGNVFGLDLLISLKTELDNSTLQRIAKTSMLDSHSFDCCCKV